MPNLYIVSSLNHIISAHLFGPTGSRKHYSFNWCIFCLVSRHLVI